MKLLTSVGAVRPEATTSEYDRAALGAGIVHLGCGAFHRAHQAEYTDTALDTAGGDWMIIGASLRGHDVADALNAQNGLYTLLIRGAEGTHARVIGSISRVIAARRDGSALLDAMSVSATRIVSMTVTEKAYGLDRKSGGINAKDPVIAEDLCNPRHPRGVIGLLVEALRQRHTADIKPFTVLCCDNLPDNGQTVRAAVLDFAARLEQSTQLPAGLTAWIESEVAFPATMVDRITPAATAATLRETAELLGLQDLAAIETEPFSQWVVEEHFPTGRPAWEAGGALMVESVAPYENMKLRMLNGAHSMIAYTGVVAGLETVFDAIADRSVQRLVRRHMAAAAATLDPLPGVDFEQYAEQLISRFANPAIRHLTRQIAMDGSEKLPQRILAAAAEAEVRGQDRRAFTFATAAWMHFCRGKNDDGVNLVIDDPRADLIMAAASTAQSSGQLYDSLDEALGLIPDGPLRNVSWREEVVAFLDAMAQDGLRSVLDAESLTIGGPSTCSPSA